MPAISPMTDALLMARVCLAVVFVLAAVRKLADRPGLRATLGEFGLAARLAGLARWCCRWRSSWSRCCWSLLRRRGRVRSGRSGCWVVFCTVITRAIVRGERPGCNCFGQLHSAPVGARTLARNVALAALAGTVAVAGPGQGVGAALAGVDLLLPAGVVVLVGALVVQAWFSWQLFAQNGRLIDRRARARGRGRRPTGSVW